MIGEGGIATKTDDRDWLHHLKQAARLEEAGAQASKRLGHGNRRAASEGGRGNAVHRAGREIGAVFLGALVRRQLDRKTAARKLLRQSRSWEEMSAGTAGGE